MRKKEMTDLLAERAERISLLEQRLESQSQMIENFRTREQTIVDSFASSQMEVRERVAAAQTKADALIKSAEDQLQTARLNAQLRANDILAAAQAQADALLASAKAQSEQIISDARVSVKEQEQETARYHALVMQSAQQMSERAAQFAAFFNGGGVDTEGSCAAPEAQPELPDTHGDPALLMKNIYAIQNRDIPASVCPQPEQAQQSDQVGRPPEPVAEKRKQPEPEQTFQWESFMQSAGAMPAEEEIPDLAPRPEREWRPEDEVDATGEWQPEAEPELEIPTVSELMPDEPEDTLSLDALLDEIIKAGE